MTKLRVNKTERRSGESRETIARMSHDHRANVLNHSQLHGPSMFAVKTKIYGVSYNQSNSIAFDETSSYWWAPKAPDFAAFYWSPHGSLVSIGHLFVTTRVVYLSKRTETSLITESDEADLITESDRAVRAVHSCSSWLCREWFVFCPMWPGYI